MASVAVDSKAPEVDKVVQNDAVTRTDADVEVEPAPETETAPNEETSEKDSTEGAPKKRGRKRKVPVEEAEKKPQTESESAEKVAAADPNDETESDEEKPAAKRPRGRPPGSVNKAKKPRGRPRKQPQAVDDSETEDEGPSELEKRVEALPEEIKSKFGNIVWVKMGGYPYWPALITDPRRLNPKFQPAALKDLETKYFVCFYESLNFSATLFKNVEAWDDDKHNYRDGHPTKDAKAPKRRATLMRAIELADKDVSLPIEERMNGLLKAEAEEKPAKESAPAPKKKMGRPPGSKNKAKVTQVEAEVEGTTKPKRGRKKADMEEGAGGDDATSEEATEPSPVAQEEGEDEDAEAPALSKEEIKAKIASRKAPKKRAAADDKAGPAAKKPAKATTKADAAIKASSEIDTKRKKEIELVVPRKSVKSADIREATDEAAQKKIGGKEKVKDKIEYKVGNISQFASKMLRLKANESSVNNNLLIEMLTQLLDEKAVHVSDVKRSGLASIITELRKSLNPTVGQTASAVRKHLMRILVKDDDAPQAAKSNSTESEGDATKANPTEGSETTRKEDGGVKSEASTTAVPTEEKIGDKEEASVANDEMKPEVKGEDAENQSATTNSAPEAPVEKNDDAQKSPAKETPDQPPAEEEKADPMADKHRKSCIDMLSNALKVNGDGYQRIAKEVEGALFDRFMESNEEYRAYARMITFNLRKAANVRERLISGSLHALELAYVSDEFFKNS